MLRYLKLAGVRDDDVLLGLIALTFRYILNGLDNIHALKNPAKHDVFAIQPAGDDCGDEELRPVSIFTRVSHRENTRFGVAKFEILVSKALSVDRLWKW
jgi:hypothetical protein